MGNIISAYQHILTNVPIAVLGKYECDLLAHGFEPTGAVGFLLYIFYWHFEGYISQTVQDSR